ncbi:MAG: GNAT family N-acetyltransferase [Planctomycetota bacterium]|nr:GNAT family N-acetyltransferase [Planctomycetota bacterium]
MVDPASVRNEELVIELCGPADRAEQARLFNACFKKRSTEEDLAWRYDRGAHGPAVSLVARPPGGEGICGYACSPRRALAFGDEGTLASVGQTGDVMTHPEWRKRGIFSDLDRRCMEETSRLDWPLVFGFPNRRSAHIFLKLGWEEIGFLRPWTFVLRGDAAARSVMRTSGRVRGWLTRWHALRCARAEKRLRSGRFEGRDLERFPADVVEIARAVERRFALMVRREAGYLDWRFLDNPGGLHAAVGLYAEGRLAGYVVVQRPFPGSKTGFLVDVLGRDDATVSAAVAMGLAKLRALGASVALATAIEGSWWSGMLASFGFLANPERERLIVILYTHAADHRLAKAARDASAWYFTDGDRDDETMG